jgi:SnoaL-like domain
LRRSSRRERPNGALHEGHPLRGLHERQGPEAVAGTAFARDLAPVFDDLNKYDATTHFVGQSTILTLTGDRATGEAYCLAHHVTVNGDKRTLMVASLRYNDTFVKINGAWLFAERLLYVDWIDDRPAP